MENNKSGFCVYGASTVCRYRYLGREGDAVGVRIATVALPEGVHGLLKILMKSSKINKGHASL